MEEMMLEFDCGVFFLNKASSMVDYNNIEEDNNIYYLEKVIKAIVVLLIFFSKLRFINGGKQ